MGFAPDERLAADADGLLDGLLRLTRLAVTLPSACAAPDSSLSRLTSGIQWLTAIDRQLCMPCRTCFRLRCGAGVRSIPAAVTSLPRKTNSCVPPSVVCSLAFSLSLSRPLPDGSGAVSGLGCTSSLACRVEY